MGTIFKGGLPPQVDQLRARIPALVDLFVTPANLGAARAEIQQPGTRLHAVNEAVRAWIAKEASERNRDEARRLEFAEYSQR
jgi:hypothetical protein